VYVYTYTSILVSALGSKVAEVDATMNYFFRILLNFRQNLRHILKYIEVNCPHKNLNYTLMIILIRHDIPDSVRLR
jgi:hypothetical protein